MIGGAGVAVLGVSVFFMLSRKRKKNTSRTTISQGSDLGKGVQVNQGNVGTTKSEPNWDNPFDMNYVEDVQKWIAPKRIVLLDSNTAKKYAKILKNAKRTINDDEDAVKDIFSKKLRDKTQVASLSKAFWDSYKMDMWQYLSSFLSQSEMNNYVHRFVKRLPNYQPQ